MSVEPMVLSELSNALAARVAASGGLAVAIRNAARQYVSGILWRSDAIVTSEQGFGAREEYEVVSAAGEATKAHIAGRDPGTNLLVLRSEKPIEAAATRSAVARAGALAIALGASGDGVRTARLGAIHFVDGQWYSRAGGRIEQRVTLDIRLRRTEEGGPVIDAEGALYGMSTLGRPGEVLVIPYATIERIAPQLLREGRVTRGWLGLALQPVAVPEALREAAGASVGMLVMSVAPDGPAARAGVIASDLLVSANDAPVRSVRQLAAQLHEDCIGKSVQLRVIRGGGIVSMEAAVSTRP
jgi:S1-C subfamily serine protease